MDASTLLALVSLSLSAAALWFVFKQTAAAAKSASAAAAQVAIAASQLHQAQESVHDDHERRCKQATLEAWIMTSDSTKEDRRQLTRAYGLEPLSSQHVQELFNDPTQTDLRLHIRDVLGSFERLAAGVNLGIFDIHVLNAVAGGPILSARRRMYGYIAEVRRTHGPDVYAQIDTLCADLERLRQGSAPTAGAIPPVP
jgi:hypothetical protein